MRRIVYVCVDVWYGCKRCVCKLAMSASSSSSYHRLIYKSNNATHFYWKHHVHCMQPIIWAKYYKLAVPCGHGIAPCEIQIVMLPLLTKLYSSVIHLFINKFLVVFIVNYLLIKICYLCASLYECGLYMRGTIWWRRERSTCSLEDIYVFFCIRLVKRQI